MTMKVSQGLRVPLVALPDVGYMLAKGEGKAETAQVFFLAATRATPRLLMGVPGDGRFGQHFASSSQN